MWEENISGFLNYHTVYVFDSLGDAGKSIQNVPLNNLEDTLSYIEDVMGDLGLEKVHLVGHSFGGGVALNFGVKYPDRIQTVTLLDPAFTLNYPKMSALIGGTLSTLPFLPEKIQTWGTSQLTGESTENITGEEPLALMIKSAMKDYSTQIPSPKVIKEEELKKISFPVYVAVAEKSPIAGQVAFENSAYIPKVTRKLYPETTHSLPMEIADELAKDLNGFWMEHDQPNQ